MPAPTERVVAGVGNLLLSLMASNDKYLTRIDLSWAFEADDYVTDAEVIPPTTATKRPTGYLIDYYIVDEKENGAKILWQPLQRNTGYSRGTYNHLRGLKPGQDVNYRVFSWHTNNYGLPAVTTGRTADAVSPDPVRGLQATADGPTKIKLDWGAVSAANNGGSPITHYVIQVHIDNPSRPSGNAGGWMNAGTSMNTTFTFSGVDDFEPLETLTAAQGAWFRIIAINSVNKADFEANPFNPGAVGIAADVAAAEPKRGETARADVPLAPEDLTTEPGEGRQLRFLG